VKNEKGVTTTEVGSVGANSGKGKGTFSASVNLDVGIVNTKEDGSTYQDMAFNFGIAEEGSGTLTLTDSRISF